MNTLNKQCARVDQACSGRDAEFTIRGANRKPDDLFFVGIGDGSVRFISSSVDLELWKALLTRAGGEVIN